MPNTRRTRVPPRTVHTQVMPMPTWKEKLAGLLPPELAEEIEFY
jgi:hypothetical protein